MWSPSSTNSHGAAGTWKSSELKFDIDPSLFPKPKNTPIKEKLTSPTADPILLSDDEYGDADIFDDLEFDICNFTNQCRKTNTLHERNAMNTATADYLQEKEEPIEMETTAPEPIQLPNGKWECRHKCADKTK